MASVVLSFGDKEIKTYQLDKPAMVVGRDAAVDIVIDNLGVSRSHCQFLRRGNAFVLQDMNSSNGTFVNGQKVGEHYLNNDDQIVVGKYTLTFKNEQQTAPADVHAKIVPDSLNTYVMDSEKIRQKMEEMRRNQAAASAPSSPAAAGAARAPAAAAPAPVPLPARTPSSPALPVADRADHHTKIIMSGVHHGPSAATLKKYLYVSLVVNIVLAIALCILLVKMVG